MDNFNYLAYVGGSLITPDLMEAIDKAIEAEIEAGLVKVDDTSKEKLTEDDLDYMFTDDHYIEDFDYEAYKIDYSIYDREDFEEDDDLSDLVLETFVSVTPDKPTGRDRHPP